MCYVFQLMSPFSAGTDSFTRFTKSTLRRRAFSVPLTLFLFGSALVRSATLSLPKNGSEPFYTNIVDRSGPWSIHVVTVPRKSGFEIRSVHATGRAIGLGELSNQTRAAQTSGAQPIAAVNGDFYQRDGAHAGDPRGLQIVDTELFSAP